MFRRVLLIAAVTLLFVPFVNAAAYSTSEKPGDFCNPATAVFNSASGECNYRNNNIFSGIKAGKECYALVDKSFSCTDAAYGKYKNGYANDGTYYEFGSFTVTGAGWDDKAKSCSYTTTGCSASYVPKAQVSPSIKASSSQNYFPAPEQTQGNYDYGCSLWATPSVVLAGQSVFVYIQRYTNTAKNSFSIGGTVDCGNGRLQLATCNGAACYSVCKYNYDGDYAINGFVKGSFCSPAFVSVTSDYSNGGYGNYPVQPISTPKPDFTKPAVSLSKTPSGKVYQDSPITLKAAASDSSGISSIEISYKTSDGERNSNVCSGTSCSISLGPLKEGTSVAYSATAVDASENNNRAESGTSSFSIELNPNSLGNIRMLVTDCDSSNPIAGAVVTIDQVSFNANSNGYALFAGLLQGYTNAYAQAQGYISGETEVFVTGASTVVQPICLEKKNKPVDNPPSIEVFRTPSGEVKNSDKIVLQATSSDDSSVKFTGIYYAIGANPFVKSSCVGSYCKTSIGPLNSDTIVTYYADAKDDSGKTTQSAFESFQVSKPASTPTPYDSIAPQVEAVRSPSNAVTEKDDILLAALSFDESGIKSTRISYRIGGAATQARSCSANRCEVNLGKLPVGTTVKYFGSAVDSSAQENYKETSAESFVVQNSFTDSKPPQVSIQRIPAGDVAAGKAIQVIASATDESRVKSTTIKYSLGGTGEEYFTCSTNYCLKSIGPFLKGDVVTYYASAVDEASNEGVSAIGSFTVGAASSGSRDGTSPFPTGSATVYVNDCGTQAPIGGARVIVGNNAGETDSSGKAVLPSVNAGTVLLNVSKSGYAQKLDSFSVFNGQNSVKTICLDKSGINLASPSCKITLAQTNPVVGESVAASVSFSDFEQAPASASVDCGDGSVKQVLCTSNSCPTTCSYPGQGTYLAKASIGQTACEQASVTAEREPAVLLVKVRDVNSQPIEGAFVDLEGFNTLRTNNAGEAAYSLSAGEYSYSISKDSFDSISAAATVIGGQANAVTKTLYKSSCAFAAEIAATTSCNANPFIAQVRVRNNDAAAQEYGISFSNANGVDKLALNPGEEKLFPLTSILPSDSAGSILSSVSISDTRGCTVNLELPLCSQSGIRLSAPATVKTTGGKRECTQVLVENKGSVDTVVSMASSPQDWSAGFDANEFVLRGQESRFVAFCASTQSGYSGEKTFIVSAYSNLNSDATSVGFDVLGQNDFSATNASTCTLAYPNSQFVKQIDLSNNYGESGDYYLAATSSSDYLSAQFAQEKVYNFAKYSTRPVYLNVGTKDLPSGSIAVTVELFEKDSGSRVYSKDYCFTSEARVNSNIFFEKNNLVLARATQRNTPLVIENNGNQDLVYVIEPASSLVTLDNYNITVPKNYRKVVTAFIKTKDSDELGLRKIPVKVYYVDQSGNKQLNAQLELNFEIVSESQSVAPLVAGEGLSIAKVESRLLPADGQVSLAVTLGNENYFEASSINLYATNLPSGVKARQKPPFSIKAYENKAEYVSLEAVNAVPGTYEIKVVAQYGTATASKFVSIKIGDKNKTVAIRLSEPIVKSIAENGLVKANVSINVSSNELSQTGFNYAIVDLENWTITATPPYSILDPKETQAVVFSLEKQNAENRDYNATLQITTNDGRVTLSPITIPVKSSGLFTGFFSLSAQDSALSILILAALLLAGGVYYQARQNASRARQIGG